MSGRQTRRSRMIFRASSSQSRSLEEGRESRFPSSIWLCSFDCGRLLQAVIQCFRFVQLEMLFLAVASGVSADWKSDIVPVTLLWRCSITTAIHHRDRGRYGWSLSMAPTSPMDRLGGEATPQDGLATYCPFGVARVWLGDDLMGVSSVARQRIRSCRGWDLRLQAHIQIGD